MPRERVSSKTQSPSSAHQRHSFEPASATTDNLLLSKKKDLLDLHSKAHSTDKNITGTTTNESGAMNANLFRRPRSYTADETFQAAKNWLLRRRQKRTGSKGSFPELQKDFGGIEERSGSLSALWSPRWKHETVSVIVIGEPKTGKTTLIGQLVDTWCESHENESPFEKNVRFSFDHNGARALAHQFKCENTSCADGSWASCGIKIGQKNTCALSISAKNDRYNATPRISKLLENILCAVVLKNNDKNFAGLNSSEKLDSFLRRLANSQEYLVVSGQPVLRKISSHSCEDLRVENGEFTNSQK